MLVFHDWVAIIIFSIYELVYTFCSSSKYTHPIDELRLLNDLIETGARLEKLKEARDGEASTPQLQLKTTEMLSNWTAGRIVVNGA